jgi:DNA-directed RNA polymerase specialized sigma24 family protein
MNDSKLSPAERDLKSVEFEALLQHLGPDREAAGARYEDLRRQLVRFFRWNNCFCGEDLADRAFDRVGQKLSRGQIQDVPAFLWGVAKNIVREFHKRPPPVNLEELPQKHEPHTGNPELGIIERKTRQQRLECLRNCLGRLNPSDRKLFLAYEYFATKGAHTRRLAERSGLSVGALQVKAHRLKHRVEKCTLKCFLSPRDPQLPGRAETEGSRDAT